MGDVEGQIRRPGGSCCGRANQLHPGAMEAFDGRVSNGRQPWSRLFFSPSSFVRARPAPHSGGAYPNCPVNSLSATA